MAKAEFFGDVDRNQRGEVSSVMPAWFHDIHIEELEHSVGQMKRQIKLGQLTPEDAFKIENDIKREEQRIKEIRDSKPKMTGGLKNQLNTAYHELRNKIADNMPSKREEKEGYVNPRDEIARWNTPHIDVDPGLAEKCNIKHKNGKITGKDAERMYKLSGKLLGEDINVEKIRKEGRSESQRSMDEQTAAILKKVSGG